MNSFETKSPPSDTGVTTHYSEHTVFRARETSFSVEEEDDEPMPGPSGINDPQPSTSQQKPSKNVRQSRLRKKSKKKRDKRRRRRPFYSSDLSSVDSSPESYRNITVTELLYKNRPSRRKDKKAEEEIMAE